MDAGEFMEWFSNQDKQDHPLIVNTQTFLDYQVFKSMMLEHKQAMEVHKPYSLSNSKTTDDVYYNEQLIISENPDWL